jgi:hypothetical protein
MPVPPNVYRFNIEASLPGGEGLTHTLHVERQDPAGGTVDLQLLTTAIKNLWTNGVMTNATTPWGAYVGSNTKYTRVSGYRLNELGRAIEQKEEVWTTQLGGATSVIAPLSMAVVASFKTAVPGRRARGRMYLGGVGINVIDGVTGRVSATARGALAVSINRLLTGINTFGVDFQQPTVRAVVLSRVAGLTYRITQIKVDDIVDVQSRRNDNLTAQSTMAVVGGLGAA